MSVLALALRRRELSQRDNTRDCPGGTLKPDTTRDALSCPNGTSLRGVPTGQAQDSWAPGTIGTPGTTGTLGTDGTPGTAGTVGTSETVEDEAATLEERVALAADSVPAAYLHAWGLLNCQRPFGVTEVEWRRALDDGGIFLDAFGSHAAVLGWTPGEIFDVSAGLVWRLAGTRVLGIDTYRVLLQGGRGLDRHREALKPQRETSGAQRQD